MLAWLHDILSEVNWKEVGESTCTYGASGTCGSIGYTTGEWVIMIGSLALVLVRASVDIPRAIDFWKKRLAKNKRKRK